MSTMTDALKGSNTDRKTNPMVLLKVRDQLFSNTNFVLTGNFVRGPYSSIYLLVIPRM